MIKPITAALAGTHDDYSATLLQCAVSYTLCECKYNLSLTRGILLPSTRKHSKCVKTMQWQLCIHRASLLAQWSFLKLCNEVKMFPNYCNCTYTLRCVWSTLFIVIQPLQRIIKGIEYPICLSLYAGEEANWFGKKECIRFPFIFSAICTLNS